GMLPWQGLRAATKRQKYEKILERKMSSPIESLCRGYACEFAAYLHYCRALRFDDKPDYAYIRKLFRELFVREGYSYDYCFDWVLLGFDADKYHRQRARVVKKGGDAGGQPAPEAPVQEEDARSRRSGKGRGREREKSSRIATEGTWPESRLSRGREGRREFRAGSGRRGGGPAGSGNGQGGTGGGSRRRGGSGSNNNQKSRPEFHF
ncbi:hypothetical protein KIPB_012650, partial [Kipferlia bialata]